MKRKLWVASLLILVSLIWGGLEKAQAKKTPPLSGGRITGEILAGSVAATGGIVMGIGVGRIIHKGTKMVPGRKRRNGEDWGKIIWSLIGGGAGLTLGSTIGVYVVGNMGNETGDFPATWNGSVVGAILGGGGATLISDSRKSMAIGVLIGSSIGATIAFNLTREREPSATSESPAAPPIYLNLVRVRF